MNISNNRPIWLLISFLKRFEKIMYSRLMEHSNINKILVEVTMWIQEKFSNARGYLKVNE